MRRQRRWCAGCCALLFTPAALVLQPASVRAGDVDILKAVPQNAWAVVIVRNLGQLDQKLMGLSQQLNVEPISALTMAKATLGLTAGINDNGSAAIVFAPGQMGMGAFGEPWKYIALLLPTQDYATFSAALSPEDAGEGISKVTIAAEPSFIAQHGAFAVAAATPEAVKAIVSSAGGPAVDAAWSPHQLERYSQDDVTLFLNLKTVLGDPAIAGMLAGMAAMSGQPLDPQELQEYEAVTVSVRLEKDGVRLGIYTGFKEGSNTAQKWTVTPPTANTMLAGLPGEKYALAVGATDNAAGAQIMAESFEKSFQQVMNTLPPDVDRAKMTETVGLITAMVKEMRDLAFGVAAQPEGGDGLLAFTKVVSFESGAAAKCDKLAEILQAVGAALPMPEVQKALQAVKYTPAAENADGVTVNHLAIQIDQVEGPTPDDIAKLKKIVGSEGLLFRVAAVDDKHVVATLGGGLPRLTQVIGLVKSNAAPLAEDAGIKQAAAMLPNSRYMEGYLDADTTLSLASNIAVAVGEEPVPFTVPEVDAPLAMVMAPVGKTGVQTDVAIPMPVIVAAKNVAASFSGGGAAPQQEAAGEPNGM